MARTPLLPGVFGGPAADRKPSPKRSTSAGKYHMGGYVDQDDPTVTEFRILAARTRRSQIDLLMEAVADLVAKHRAEEAFGKR